MSKELEALGIISNYIVYEEKENNYKVSMFAEHPSEINLIKNALLHYQELKDTKLGSFQETIRVLRKQYNDKCNEIYNLKSKIKHIEKTLNDMITKLLGEIK